MSKGRLLFGILITSILITGCEGQQIFRDKDSEIKLEEVSKNQLEENIFYVKNGTKFGAVYDANSNKKSSGIAQVDFSKIRYFLNDEPMVPDYYKNEYIALSQSSLDVKEMYLERYKDLNYSFGLYGCTVDDDNYLCFDLKKNTIKESDLFNKLSTAKSSEIRITAIDGEPVSEKNINSAGVIVGLEKDKEYTVSFYTGTYYGTVTVAADTHILQSFEVYDVSNIETTKNGYLKITLPDDLKSGWYLMNGQGIFRYFDFVKGDKDIAKLDMNEEYYKTDEEKEAMYTQQYVVSIAEKIKNVSVILTYNPQQYNEEDIKVKLKSPDGTVIEMKPSLGTAQASLKEAIAGKWTVSVIPKDLEVTNLVADSKKVATDASIETKEFTLTEDFENVEFSATYAGEGEVWGTVENENGESQEFSEAKDGKLSYIYPYLPAGTYTVNIYHYTDTKINEITCEDDVVETTTDIITVVE